MCDVILIADNGIDTFSATNPLRLTLDGHPANIQVVRNFISNGGKVVPPIAGDGLYSWESAPKLNGIYLYNFLTNQGIKTALINNFEKERETFKKMAATKPKVVAISTTFMVSRQTVFNLVSEVKAICPEAKVVIGGPLVYISWLIVQRAPEDPLYNSEETRQQYLFFDSTGDQSDLYIISNLGHTLLGRAVHSIIAGNDAWRSIPNTAHLVGGNYLFADRIDDISDHKDIPIDWASLPENLFTNGVLPMRASVGCPYRCNFCNFNKDPRLTYIKPLDDLIAELKAVQARGIKYVWFVDDNFRLGKRDLEKVCQRFIDEGISLGWMTLIRPEVLKDVDLGLLKQAGCREVQMGLESADQRMLDYMNKQSDPNVNEEVIRRLITAGINCSCYFIFGYPGETDESLSKTTDFIKRLEKQDGPGFFNWSIYPFLLAPFSPVYDHRSEHDLDGYLQRWTHKTMSSEEAKQHLLHAFMAIDQSGPIYRGDNLDLLNALPAKQGRAFLATRHRLEKMGLSKELNNEIAFQAFSQFFN